VDPATSSLTGTARRTTPWRSTFGGRPSPYDRGLSDLVGELSTRSEKFRIRLAAHNVWIHRAGVKHLRHPVVGDLGLTFEMMELSADPGLSILTYSAEPGTRSEEALSLLGSWAATLDQEERARATDEVRRA
jgi:MmyB-like transcription regulator ligand binding domain